VLTESAADGEMEDWKIGRTMILPGRLFFESYPFGESANLPFFHPSIIPA
jgi:hypothetical protein